MSAPPGAYGPGTYGPGAQPTKALRTDYAPWGRRFVAGLIDAAPGLIAVVLIYVALGMWIAAAIKDTSQGNPPTAFNPLGPLMIIGIVLWVLALGWNIGNRWFLAGRTGQSFGKRMMKLWLVGEQTTTPIGPLNAFLRELLHQLDGAALVGYFWPMIDDQRQTFADKLINSVVITTPVEPLPRKTESAHQ